VPKNQHTGGAGARWETDGRWITPVGRPGAVLAETAYMKRGPAAKDAERLANARLMAAAPEMLDALRSVASQGCYVSVETMADIRSAIANATGGEG
jgi:hypothetical protein